MKNKLETLPYYALVDLAFQKKIDESEIKNKDKSEVIRKLLLFGNLEEREVDLLVDNYIYGNRVTFTLWTIVDKFEKQEYEKIYSLNNMNVIIPESLNEDFRNMNIVRVRKCFDRIEILYVYSKKHRYINEQGEHSEVWEQHRGCLWIGIERSYLASISKHEKVTDIMIKFLSNNFSRTISKLTPPKQAIDRFTKPEAISRIVLQGFGGEKSIFSNRKGLTSEQEVAIKGFKGYSMDIAGSYVAELANNIKGTVKYNAKKGSIGIYKHLSTDVLFEWTRQAIDITFEEIEALKGKSAEEIFEATGKKIKWQGLSKLYEKQMNWFLSVIINSLESEEDLRIDLSNDVKEILENKQLFMKLPRMYCNKCNTYELLYCDNCNKEIKVSNEGMMICECGSTEIRCEEGHSDFSFEWWYIPTEKFFSMINYNIKQLYINKLDYNMCIMGRRLELVKNSHDNNGSEIYFDDVECFSSKKGVYTPPENIWKMAVRLNEKCDDTCTNVTSKSCVSDKSKLCLPKIFYPLLQGYRPQPHKGLEYGDVSGEIKVGNKKFEMKGIIKRNTKREKNKEVTEKEEVEMFATTLLSTSKAGEEIIRQFVEQGMNDARCQVIAVIIPQYIDAGFKGTLRFLAKLVDKKVLFIGLEEICKLIEMNDYVEIL